MYQPAPVPFEKLHFNSENSIILNDPIEMLVLHTGDEDIFPSFNEYTVNRCSLDETPCGGMKYSITADMKPGTVEIVGEGCYLKNIAGTEIKKIISAGKLAENEEIHTSGESGISYCTEDGIEYCTEDSQAYTIISPYMIVDEFQVLNVTDTAKTCTITIRCPDEISEIKLYNLDTFEYEDTTFTQITQSFGTLNSYSFTRTISERTIERLQVMITYTTLQHTFKFSNDANRSCGIHNLNSWITYYDISSNKINFITFTKTPEEIVCIQDSSGIITSLTIKCNNCIAKRGQIIYDNTSINLQASEQFVDCFNQNMPGSLTKFLNTFTSTSEIIDTNITTYVVPAISNNKILPNSDISDELQSNTIYIKSSVSEYTCASFVIKSDKDININVKISDLTGISSTISKNNIDLKYVECWYQGGINTDTTHKLGHYYTPELLVNDPKLIKTNCDEWEYYNIPNESAKNELKLNTGKYIDITSKTPSTSGFYKPTITERPIYDADYLQPINLIKNYNKQIWITTHVPEGTVAGTYTGVITIETSDYILKSINISIEVLPITLLQSSKEYSIYHRSQLKDVGTISSEDKNIEQYEAELDDMAKHGIISPSCYQLPSDSLLSSVLSLRQQYFPTCTNLYIVSRSIKNITLSDISTLITTGTTYGINKVYIYGYDESDMNTAEIRAQIQTVHDNGAFVFCAQKPTYALSVKDVLDLAIGSSSFTTAQIAEFQATGHKVFSYGHPQTVLEYPLTFRRNYGLYLWQNNYDGAMPYAYQHAMRDIYSDFDDEIYRDHCFAYPTANGVLDTLQWEGFREGVNDIRYMTTLESTVAEANVNNIDTLTIDLWLNDLKIIDLTTVNLDVIRNEIMNYIIDLRNAIDGNTTTIDCGSANTIDTSFIDCGSADTVDNVIISGSFI